MSSLSITIATGFVNQYTDFGLRVHRLAEDLPIEVLAGTHCLVSAELQKNTWGSWPFVS
jgi:hypothetical protein